ncbi:acetyltransferase [Staphylococcus warneri]|uniref:acetyltransferase n=1 Tax=Staphylococcus warneri TaxID=1292 RepID=UPI0032617033
MTITLSDKQIKNTFKNIFKLLDELDKTLKEHDAYKQQRDELIKDIAKLRKRHDEAMGKWRELKNITLAEYEWYNSRLKKIEDRDLATLTRLSQTRYFLLHMDELDGTSEFEEFLEGLDKWNEEANND